jgi:predicted metal-dependent hydrolase
MHFDWTSGELAEGLLCYREQRFWHAHEHWEAVWLTLAGQEKTFLQALIQTTAAFHHWQRGNLVGTASLLRNALRRLDPLPSEFGGIDVDGLRKSLRSWLGALEQSKMTGKPVAAMPFPPIR